MDRTRYTQKVIAACGLACAMAGFGVSVGAGVAGADGTKPDTGSYDEYLKVVEPPTQTLLAGSFGPHGGDMGTWDELLHHIVYSIFHDPNARS
jgi:hypothetical protein